QASFTGAHFEREFGVWYFGLAEQEKLQLVEIFEAAVPDKLSLEAPEHPVHQGDCPVSFEDMFRRFVVEWFEAVTFLAGGDFKRQNGASAAFLGACAVRLVGEKEFARIQQERAETASVRIGAIQVAALEDADKEVLGEVLRLFLGVSPTAHVRVNGIPVAFAKPHQSLTAFLPPWIAGRH